MDLESVVLVLRDDVEIRVASLVASLMILPPFLFLVFALCEDVDDAGGYAGSRLKSGSRDGLV